MNENPTKPPSAPGAWTKIKSALASLIYILPPSFRARLQGPAEELTVHFLLSILALVFIHLAELVMKGFDLAERHVPFLGIKLEDWMFDLDVTSVSLILIAGLIKSLWEMWK